jgi:hypothetical protein
LGGPDWQVLGGLGVGVTIPLNKHLYVVSEVNVEQKGSSMDLEREGVQIGSCGFAGCNFSPLKGRASTRVTYLTVPVLVGYQMGRIAVQAGPYIGLKTGAVYQVSIESPSLSRLANMDWTYKPLDAGFAIGVSYNLFHRITADIRYSQGLLPFTESNRWANEKSYHQTAQLGLRYNLLR